MLERGHGPLLVQFGEDVGPRPKAAAVGKSPRPMTATSLRPNDCSAVTVTFIGDDVATGLLRIEGCRGDGPPCGGAPRRARPQAEEILHPVCMSGLFFTSRLAWFSTVVTTWTLQIGRGRQQGNDRQRIWRDSTDRVKPHRANGTYAELAATSGGEEA